MSSLTGYRFKTPTEAEVVASLSPENQILWKKFPFPEVRDAIVLKDMKEKLPKLGKIKFLNE